MKPLITVAKDIETENEIENVLDQAQGLQEFCGIVVVVPKTKEVMEVLDHATLKQYLLGYSVPTGYAGASWSPEGLKGPVHLLGGRPEVQRRLARLMHVVSFDCNRFTIDAAFGDYSDGEIFRPHPTGGYGRCLEDSLTNINRIWADYSIGGADTQYDRTAGVEHRMRIAGPG